MAHVDIIPRLLNFGPLMGSIAPEELARAIGSHNRIDVQFELDVNMPKDIQVEEYLDDFYLTAAEWMNTPWFVRLPEDQAAAALILTGIFARARSFPGLVVIETDPKGTPRLSEVVDLQGVYERMPSPRPTRG